MLTCALTHSELKISSDNNVDLIALKYGTVIFFEWLFPQLIYPGSQSLNFWFKTFSLIDHSLSMAGLEIRVAAVNLLPLRACCK